MVQIAVFLVEDDNPLVEPRQTRTQKKRIIANKIKEMFNDIIDEIFRPDLILFKRGLTVNEKYQIDELMSDIDGAKCILLKGPFSQQYDNVIEEITLDEMQEIILSTKPRI